ncbi:uncharacterized protein B4U79_16459 [Dinothrombium tinctorium]|nr:uncharacterized protein B4U79_16459 [Dinothrombium tinctorium]
MVSINSQEESAFLKNSIVTEAKGLFWLGALNLIPNINSFFWLNGNHFNYTDWNEGEPNNLNAECLAIDLGYYKSKIAWHDAGCNFQRQQICQKHLTEDDFVAHSFPNFLIEKLNLIDESKIYTLQKQFNEIKLNLREITSVNEVTSTRLASLESSKFELMNDVSHMNQRFDTETRKISNNSKTIQLLESKMENQLQNISESESELKNETIFLLTEQSNVMEEINERIMNELQATNSSLYNMQINLTKLFVKFDKFSKEIEKYKSVSVQNLNQIEQKAHKENDKGTDLTFISIVLFSIAIVLLIINAILLCQSRKFMIRRTQENLIELK